MPCSPGMFVTKAGTCQRPPLQWSLEVQAARVCFPYVLTLQPHMLFVYSILDQRHKQTVSQHGAKGLLSTPGEPYSLITKTRFLSQLSLLPAAAPTPVNRTCSPLRRCHSVHRNRHFHSSPGACSRADPSTGGREASPGGVNAAGRSSTSSTT